MGGCLSSKPAAQATPSEKVSKAESQGSDASPKGVAADKDQIVMGKYKIPSTKKSFMGEGATSICSKGVDIETQDPVAVKVYKEAVFRDAGVLLMRFKRQVTVLEQLQLPFEKGPNKDLWHPFFEDADPGTLFMRMVNYSKNAKGEPGPDATDSKYYVITELGQYSLKDFLDKNREDKRPLSANLIKSMSLSLLRVVAGLHAKGLVHIDLKPENIMSFRGCLKLIDVDGCVSIGTEVRIEDKSVSFSPCYCSPQWATFLIDELVSKHTVDPGLDAWSIGLTLAELVSLRPVMQPVYTNLLKKANSHGQAGFLFMDWLRSCNRVPLPEETRTFDKGFVDLLSKWLLVPSDLKRKTCAQCLDHPYLKEAALRESEAKAKKEVPMALSSENITHTPKETGATSSGQRRKSVDLHKGRVWQLIDNGDLQDRKDWIEHDTWLGPQGTLSFFDTKDKKICVLADPSMLCAGEINMCPAKQGARGPVFEISYPSSAVAPGSPQQRKEDSTASKDKDQLATQEVITLACDVKAEAEDWVSKLKKIARMDLPTMHLGDDVAELRQFVISVKNRRITVRSEDINNEEYQPLFKEKLWKLRADGDRRKEEDWRERETWISNNGSLIYSSKKENRDLVYYTGEDLAKATCNVVPASESCKPYSFQVILPVVDGCEFAPADFAANSAESRTEWMATFLRSAEGFNADGANISL